MHFKGIFELLRLRPLLGCQHCGVFLGALRLQIFKELDSVCEPNALLFVPANSILRVRGNCPRGRGDTAVVVLGDNFAAEVSGRECKGGNLPRRVLCNPRDRDSAKLI